MKNLSKEEVRTAKEIIDKYFPSGLHEDPEQSELNKIFIFNAMEEYASQFKSQSEAVGWISVKERLPKTCSTVLVWHKERNTILRATLYNNGYRSRTYHWHYYDVDGSNRMELKDITHWQPLPSPPEVSVGEEKKD